MEHTFALSIVVMIPILSWEFFLIYGMRIRVVNHTYFFKEYGTYFRWQMKWPIFEQFYIYLTLLNFYMMISCYINKLEKSSENNLLSFFR